MAGEAPWARVALWPPAFPSGQSRGSRPQARASPPGPTLWPASSPALLGWRCTCGRAFPPDPARRHVLRECVRVHPGDDLPLPLPLPTLRVQGRELHCPGLPSLSVCALTGGAVGTCCTGGSCVTSPLPTVPGRSPHAGSSPCSWESAHHSPRTQPPGPSDPRHLPPSLVSSEPCILEPSFAHLSPCSREGGSHLPECLAHGNYLIIMYQNLQRGREEIFVPACSQQPGSNSSVH